jgi:hypothetical protein
MGLLILAAKCLAQSRIVDYVAPSLVGTNGGMLPLPSALRAIDLSGTESAIRPSQELDAGQRWERFQAEFGLGKKNPSFILSSIEVAKYQLDEATFSIQEFARNVEQSLKFDYGIADLVGAAPYVSSSVRRSTGNFMRDSLEQARLKSDIRLLAGRESFVGFKLEMPFGD